MIKHALLALSAVALATAAHADDTPSLGTITVEAARVGKPSTALPYTVTVISRQELEQQLALGSDIAAILANELPSYSPSRQKLTGFGETLRGREPLFMIDGVPQSNPLRNGSRDGYTIDPEMIERIEIIHGANAIQGTGATGGIINFVTRSAQAGQPTETRYSVQASINDDFSGDSLGTRLHLQQAGSLDDFYYLVGLSGMKTGLFYDAEDRPIAVDNTQGDTMDGRSFDAFAKLGYRFGEQRLQFEFNRFQFGSDGDYVVQPGDRSIGLPATSVPGEVRGEPAENDVTTLSLDYSHSGLGPGRFDWQVFSQDFAGTYGGGAYGVFQDPSIGPAVFDQSRNISEKLGSKITYNLPDLTANFGLTVGFDWLRDTTRQELAQTGRVWVPETTYVNTAPFAQLSWQAGPVSLTAGARREHARLDVGTFRTLAAYNNTLVKGGSPEFSETLTNVGANWTINDNWTLFASVSEGFNMPDVGRVLRGIATPGLDVDTFLNLQPIVADNREIGTQFHARSADFRISYFESDSDLGARLVPDDDGIFSVNREKTEIRGIELSSHYYVGDMTEFGLDYAHLNGRFDSNGDGRVDSDLGGINIAPDRVNVYWQQNWSPVWLTRLQVNHLFDRNFESQGVQTAQFDGYTTLDLVA
ncbi:MAG TPA: TonB-dependent receptor, partial [Gammaproteobacteria bacterium]|nr:TonB-dependent receptor [Gammaproteobacteria bacterium]